MFRDTKSSGMSYEKLGVGSIIEGDNRIQFLIVGANTESSVQILNLKTMVLSDNSVPVQDINFLSTNEARVLCNYVESSWTFSDFDFNSKGLKQL